MTQPRFVGGRYELGELIGYGGMAEVHRGQDTRLNREVAIKVLRADLARDPSFLTRFRREAHSAAGLNHPSIVAIYDTGEDTAPDGTAIPFIVMEYVKGRTLREVLRTEGRLPGPRAMEITADICAALEFSHRNGIVHRDIKPANVMITNAGAVKVMDFGIARAVADTSATVTQTANVIGTAQYLSPEQARGEQVDARSDVYSTGCLLYELVCGVPPFQGDSPVAVAYQHVRENPVMPSARNADIPRAIDSIVMKALAKNPFNRYQSAGDMRADLQRALANQPVTAEAVMTDDERTQFIARAPAPVPVAGRRDYDDEDEDHTRRNAVIWVAVVLALLLVIGGGVYLFSQSGGGGDDKKMVALESVIGQTPQAARDALRQQKLQARQGPNTGGDCTDENGQKITVSEGNVCTTSPAPGTSVEEGSVVTYRLYQQQLVPVPYVVDKQYSAAVNELGKYGLLAKKKGVFNTKPAGTVLDQSVTAYKQLKPGSTVTLTVSNGLVKLPNLVGKTEDEAKNAIPDDFQDVRTIPRITRDRGQDGKVFQQSPKAGGYPAKTQITLYVYRYRAPEPTCNPSAPPSTPASGAPTSPSSPSSDGPVNTLPPCNTGSSAPSGAPSS
ncbi:Stk1 family PASTA domain-containing Ser/Thr kinase [Jatrophihabitans fulvus]